MSKETHDINWHEVRLNEIPMFIIRRKGTLECCVKLLHSQAKVIEAVAGIYPDSQLVSSDYRCNFWPRSKVHYVFDVKIPPPEEY